jgi:divalent metal cation (Fe/Co/Zn/Cd) transporter
MAPQARGGLIVTVVGFFAGIWLFLAPFLVEYQKVGQDWSAPTKHHLWTGGALMAISALTLILLAAFALRDAARAAEQKNIAEAEES